MEEAPTKDAAAQRSGRWQGMGNSSRGSSEGGDNCRSATVRLFARSSAVSRAHGEGSLMLFQGQTDAVRCTEARHGVSLSQEIAHRCGGDEDGYGFMLQVSGKNPTGPFYLYAILGPKLASQGLYL
jgi:hypothetical protein